LMEKKRQPNFTADEIKVCGVEKNKDRRAAMYKYSQLHISETASSQILVHRSSLAVEYNRYLFFYS